jgi:hypothetical protein
VKLPRRVMEVIDYYAPPKDRQLLYHMARKESGGDPSAVSPTGAKGLFQFTRGTGRKYGLLGPQGDLRGDDIKNTQAAIKLLEDNRAVLRKQLGREPTGSEAYLAHQQGAGTAAKMLTGKGNAPANNLRVNNIDPRLGPQEAAKQIMNRFGFNDMGMTLASNPFGDVPQIPLPGAEGLPPPATVGPPVNATPYVNPGIGTGVSLNSNPISPNIGWGGSVGLGGGTEMLTPPPIIPEPPPAPPPSPAPTEVATGGPEGGGMMAKMMGADGKGGAGSPFASGMKAMETIAKGIQGPPPDPKANEILPSTSASVDQRIMQQQQLAQGLLSQMLQQRKQQQGLL